MRVRRTFEEVLLPRRLGWSGTVLAGCGLVAGRRRWAWEVSQEGVADGGGVWVPELGHGMVA